MIRDCPLDPSPQWVRVHAVFIEDRAIHADDAIDTRISDYAQHSSADDAVQEIEESDQSMSLRLTDDL